MAFDVPVLLIAWTRPDTTRRVLEQLARVQPRTLLVALDGPRHPDQEGAIRETRALFDNLAWECDVIRTESEVNLGLARRMVSAIDFAFEHVDRVIVLEDDILAHESFFPFCGELLQRYADDPRIMSIRGTSNRPSRQWPTEDSYVFTRFTSPWGWATWKRAWAGFDHSWLDTGQAQFLNRHPRVEGAWKSLAQIPYWPRLRRDPALRERLASCGDRYAFWLEKCDRRMYSRSWAGFWALHTIASDGLVVTPRANLVSNIGVTPDAEHTRPGLKIPQSLDVEAMPFPLQHPETIDIIPDLHRQIAEETNRNWRDGRRLIRRRWVPRRWS